MIDDETINDNKQIDDDERIKEFFLGVDQFNEKEFFECHETLEHLWKKDCSNERELIQGIIQVAVGYYHYLRNNRVGALKLLTRGLARIQKYDDHALHLNIRRLSAEVESNIQTIETSQVDTFPPLSIPIIEVFRD